MLYFQFYTITDYALEYFLKLAFKITEIGDSAIQMNNFFKNDHK